MACRDGYSSSNIIFQPAAKHAKWSSRKLMRGEVVIRDFLKIRCTELDERPPEHASDYGGSNGLYWKFWICSLVNDLARPTSGCKVRFWETVIVLRCFAHLFIIGCVLFTELDERPPEHADQIRESNGLYYRFWEMSLVDDLAAPRSSRGIGLHGTVFCFELRGCVEVNSVTISTGPTRGNHGWRFTARIQVPLHRRQMVPDYYR